MKIYENSDGTIVPADRVIEYADAIQRDYEYGVEMGEPVRQTFMASAHGTFTMAQTELTSAESDLLCDVLKGRLDLE